MAENNLEEIKICIQILPDMSEEAQTKAIEENPQNAKTGLNFIKKFGDTVESSRMAVIADRKWKPGRTLRVRFLDGARVVQQKIAAVSRCLFNALCEYLMMASTLFLLGWVLSPFSVSQITWIVSPLSGEIKAVISFPCINKKHCGWDSPARVSSQTQSKLL
ncbi:MAG: hypothetical protein KME54_15545 [Tolypothrix brevis GSE-NOS-MK-07-07A]|jgi:hypothetical protein|nr:hypothetical protein [Tolypothrix brevis GSE-NOS-MK-07-07A]